MAANLNDPATPATNPNSEESSAPGSPSAPLADAGAGEPGLFGEVIYAYTRAQAIEDGVLCDLAAVAPDVCGQHFKTPIACTSAVWAIIDRAVKNKKWCNDYAGVIHDLLWMSRMNRTRRSADGTTMLFNVIIQGAGRRSIFEFKAVCGPGDDAEPVVTIMMPDED